MNPTEMPTTSENNKNIGGGEEGELNHYSICTFRLCVTKEIVLSLLVLQILSVEN